MKIKKLLLNTVMIFMITASVFAQDEVGESYSKRNIGLSATLQGMQFGVNVPIWIGEKITIGPSFEFLYAEKTGSDLGLGLVTKIYIKQSKVSPYAGVKFGFISNTPDKTLLVKQEKTTDIIAGIALGGEYFFDRQFSISIEIQGNFSKSDTESFRFGNPDGLNFNTTSMVAANIYF